MNRDSSAPATELQLERAEFAEGQAPAFVCLACRGSISGVYYAIGEGALCGACRAQLERERNSGSGLVRFTRAVLFGVPAAVAGAVLYYAVAALTGYEFGLVSILIGVMVGAAVRRGAHARGGWVYQTLAVGLTYCAIVSTYVPFLIAAVNQDIAAQRAAAEPPMSSAVAETHVSPAAALEATARPAPQPDAGALVTGLLLVVGVVLATPFLAGTENIMGIIIIAIGLYEAWKLNRRGDLAISGPYEIGAAPAALHAVGSGTR